MDTISNILQHKQLTPKKVGATHEWQDRAARVVDKLELKLVGSQISGWYRFFKITPKVKIDRAYSYLMDYNKPITNEHKIKLFYWLVKNL